MDKNRYRLSDHLYLDEVVDVKTYCKYAKTNKLYRLANKIDNQLVRAFEYVRISMDEAATCNNWWNTFVKNNYNCDLTYKEVEADDYLAQWRGYRPKGTPYYNEDSQHSEFKALDLIFKSGAEVARNLIEANWEEWGVCAIELAVSWLHIDTRFIPYQTELFKFNK